MRLGLFFIVVLAFSPLLLNSLNSASNSGFSLADVGQLVKTPVEDADYHAQFASSGVTKEVHSAVMARLANGNLRAFWYGGKREGAKDVSIYTAELDLQTNEWIGEKVLVERHDMANQLGVYLRKIGNPVTFRDNEGRLWLFFVTVSVGGWAGSSINFITSTDEGESWSSPTRLVTSPIFNLSTLVKGEPYLYNDGSIGLPVYHEMIGKFGELLHLSQEGEVLDKTRLMPGRVSLQPIVLPSDESHARIYMRNATDFADSRLYETWTADGGQTWAPVVLSELPNPNAAVTGLRLEDGSMLMVLNHQHDKRNNLSLVRSTDDGENWQLLHAFEQEENTAEFEHQFAYPSLRQSADGDFHVLYTWNKERIKHIRFNQQWLHEQQETLK